MDLCFGSEQLATIFKAELNHHTRKTEESLSALGQDIRRLARLAYPNFTAEAVEEIAREKFIEALPDAPLCLQMHNARTATLEVASEYALHSEAWTTAKAARQPPQHRVRSITESELLLDTVKGLREKVEEIKLSHRSVCERRCYNCNQLGHVAKSCQSG